MRRVAALALGWLVGCARPPFPVGEVVDLTHPFDEETIFWPTEEGFVLERGFQGETEEGYWYEANRFRTAEHGGTHVDAPAHFARGRQTVDAVPLERLMGPAAVVDVEQACAAEPDYQVRVEDLRAWEERHGRIPPGAVVLLRTGLGRHWGDRARYLGTARRGAEAVAELHFPGLHPDAARWLVEERRIFAVGLDTPSIDHGPSRLFETHRILSARDVPAFENLANLERLPPTGAHFVGLPMKIRGGSGAPLRAIAILP